MTQHTTEDGAEVTVREDRERDLFRIVTRRPAMGDRPPQYLYATTNKTAPGVTMTHWYGPTSDAATIELAAGTDAPGFSIRRRDARAIVAALSEALGLPSDLESTRDERDALRADLADVTQERDEARHEAALNGQTATTWEVLCLEKDDTLAATKRHLKFVRRMLGAYAARLERAETPPIMATLATTDLEPAWQALDVQEALRLGRLVLDVSNGRTHRTEIRGVVIAPCDDHGRTDLERSLEEDPPATGGPDRPTVPSSTPGENPGDDGREVGAKVRDRSGLLWERLPDGWWRPFHHAETMAFHRLDWITTAWGPVADAEPGK